MQKSNISVSYYIFCIEAAIRNIQKQGSSVQDELRNVARITGSLSAFAALRFDGSVVCWGDAECGGDAGERLVLGWLVVTGT